MVLDSVLSQEEIPDTARHALRSSRQFLAEMAAPLGISAELTNAVLFQEAGDLPSVFAVSDFAAAAIATSAVAVAEFIATRFGLTPQVMVGRRQASLWFGWSIRPIGWSLPAPWDPIAGDYAASDGWIRLHTNAPHHRDAALAVLGVSADRMQVSRAVAGWQMEHLETAVVERNGCAAAMRTMEEWASHAQGAAVAQDPLIALNTTEDYRGTHCISTPDRPLAGVRVLDLTRVLAGPVATRFLAGYGADVLRIDPPGWDEPSVVPEVTLGKRCARLDLRDPAGKARFLELLSQADVVVHGYRADALDDLGLDAATRRQISPGLIDVCLNAYGWNGPWRNRRGFDSLVQMSVGIAHAGMMRLGRDRPTPLPVQALDHAAGYLLAAAAVRGLTTRLRSNQGFEARLSLARTAQLLISGAPGSAQDTLLRAGDEDYSDVPELSEFGLAHRMKPPVVVGGAPMSWDHGAAMLGGSAAAW